MALPSLDRSKVGLSSKRFGKLDLHRVKRGAAVSTLDPSYESFVIEHGWGDLGRHLEVRILGPHDVLDQTVKTREWGAPPDSICVATISFDGHIVWLSARGRYVRMNRQPPGTVDLGASFDQALGHVLHLQSALDQALPLKAYDS